MIKPDFIFNEPDPKILAMVQKNNEILLKKGVNLMTNSKSKGSFISIGLVLAVIVGMSVCLFAACGGTSVVGNWKLDRVVNEGKTVKSTDADKGEYAEAFNNVIIFNDDKTGSIKMNSESATASTWAQTNNTITVTANNADTTFTLSGSELIYDKDGVRYFYKKSS